MWKWPVVKYKHNYENKANRPNLYTIYFVFDLGYECKFIKQNIIVIKEICSS